MWKRKHIPRLHLPFTCRTRTMLSRRIILAIASIFIFPFLLLLLLFLLLLPTFPCVNNMRILSGRARGPRLRLPRFHAHCAVDSVNLCLCNFNNSRVHKVISINVWINIGPSAHTTHLGCARFGSLTSLEPVDKRIDAFGSHLIYYI